jgi:hypothetical protein
MTRRAETVINSSDRTPGGMKKIAETLQISEEDTSALLLFSASYAHKVTTYSISNKGNQIGLYLNGISNEVLNELVSYQKYPDDVSQFVQKIPTVFEDQQYFEFGMYFQKGSKVFTPVRSAIYTAF